MLSGRNRRGFYSLFLNPISRHIWVGNRTKHVLTRKHLLVPRTSNRNPILPVSAPFDSKRNKMAIKTCKGGVKFLPFHCFDSFSRFTSKYTVESRSKLSSIHRQFITFHALYLLCTCTILSKMRK